MLVNRSCGHTPVMKGLQTWGSHMDNVDWTTPITSLPMRSSRFLRCSSASRPMLVVCSVETGVVERRSWRREGGESESVSGWVG